MHSHAYDPTKKLSFGNGGDAGNDEDGEHDIKGTATGCAWRV